MDATVLDRTVLGINRDPVLDTDVARQVLLSAPNGYGTGEFVAALERPASARMARKVFGSAVDGRTARGKGYAMGMRRRKIFEDAFGGFKTAG